MFRISGMKSEIRKRPAVEGIKAGIIGACSIFEMHFESLIDEQGKNFFEKIGGI